MTEKDTVVAGVKLRVDGPTSLTFKDLFQWVIWQFPRPEEKGLCGAVRPPVEDYDWIPAIIETGKERVYVHAHTGETFPTPELAADYFNEGKKPERN